MNEEFKYIKGFQKITIPKICVNLGIDYKNVSSGRTKQENYKKVKKEIEKEIAKLYLGDD